MTLAVTTGLDSFLNPQDIGPMYPFVGAEVWLYFVVGVILWLGWHALQITGETREEDDARQMYQEIGLDRAMFHGGSALIATDEEWREAERGRPAGGQSSSPSG